MRFNLSKKLLIPTACLIIIGMAISTLVAYFSSKNALEKTTNFQFAQITDSLSANPGSWLSCNQLDIYSWGRQYIFRNVLGNRELTDQANARLGELTNTYGFYQGIRITDRTGIVIASSSPKNVGKVNVAERVYISLIWNADSRLPEGIGRPFHFHATVLNLY